MPVPLTVSGVTYQYPTNNDTQWGLNATRWAVGVTQALSTVVVDGDLSPTALVQITNNNVSATNVAGLVFDKAVTRAAEVIYYIYRTRGVTEVVESGTLMLSYKTDLDVWYMSRTSHTDDDIGVELTVNSNGQIQYVSSDIATAGVYAGIMRYRARVIPT